MQNRYLHILSLFVLMFAIPAGMVAQTPWKKTIQLQDRQEKGKKPNVATATLSAYFMNSRLSPGDPIMMNAEGKPQTVTFGQLNEGFIKFKIDKLKWAKDLDPPYDKSPDFKIVVRSLWVDMNPRIWTEIRVPGKSVDQLRRQFINAPNVEFVYGDSLPPPFIFKLNRNGNFLFTMGFKTITPKTTLEKPFPHSFSFNVKGLLRDSPIKIEEVVEDVVEIEELPDLEDELEEDLTPEIEQEEDFSDIDAAVARARREENVNELITLMRLYPDVPSVKDARGDLAIHMRRELIDSVTYEIDIEFEKFSRALPRRDQLELTFSYGGRILTGNEKPYTTWRGEQLLVRPRRDGRDYVLIAKVKATPENTDRIVLNSVRDFIVFTYKDTLEGEAVSIHITGGASPFMLNLEQKTGDDFLGMEGAMVIYGDTVLKKDQIARAIGIKNEGDFRMFVEDAEKLKKTGRSLVHIIPPPPINPIVWYISGGGLFLLFVGYRLWVVQQHKKDEELEKLIEERGGRDPKVKRKPKPDLLSFWEETSISDLSLHKVFIDEIATYLRERPHFPPGSKPIIEGVILGTVLKFDFENEQYEVRLDRFRAIDPRPLDHYDDTPDRDKWLELKEVAADHKELVKIGWLQVVEDQPMDLKQEELQFQDENFSELFQLLLKIDIEGGVKKCGFFTRTISGKVNNSADRADSSEDWMDWDRLEDAGYYENDPKPVRQASDTSVSIKTINQQEDWA